MNFPQRSAFDLTHERKLSCYMGKLVPIMCEEIIPGDTFKVQTEILLRLAPMLAPMMHRLNVFTHFFFVPNRLLHANWESFITGGPTGTDSTVAPYISSGAGFASESLADYFGIPTGVASKNVSALPFRAYALIYNEWYRNQWLQSKVGFSTGDGADSTTNVSLLSRSWEKDYFTSALLAPQRGTAVSLPLGSEAPVLGIGKVDTQWNPGTANFYENSGTPRAFTGYQGIDESNSGTQFRIEKSAGGNFPHIRADLSSATAATINDLRLAFQVQRFLERQARGGARYIETILSQFGVKSSDARLQRPEYLGGFQCSCQYCACRANFCFFYCRFCYTAG